MEWAEASGRGKLYSWTIFYQVYDPAFAEDIPYNVGLIELEEGPSFYSNVVECKNEDLYVGMPLEVTFDDVTEEISLPKFRPTVK